jgi:3-phenylpropionate/cinnamic acid dioxygenase small subunit
LLFTRYNSPFELLGIIPISELKGFLEYAQEQLIDERAWEQYLMTTMEVSFYDFKKKSGYLPKRKQKEEKLMTEEEKQQVLDFADTFLIKRG